MSSDENKGWIDTEKEKHALKTLVVWVFRLSALGAILYLIYAILYMNLLADQYNAAG